jgi:hypothetical protein
MVPTFFLLLNPPRSAAIEQRDWWQHLGDPLLTRID